MELKTYQKSVLNDLRDYLKILDELQDPRKAFTKYWNDKGVFAKGSNSVIYHGLDPKAPDVCFKVPTGGGKTFIACAAVKEIFDRFPLDNKIVIWLVPNSAIYEQTRLAFKNPDHPYRQRLDIDFNGNVRFYEYEELLNGQGFNPQAVRDQLSICVVSYAAVRSNTKEGRRMYRPNSNLLAFDSQVNDDKSDDYMGPSLSNVISKYNPVIVLDESHNATSELSRRAIRELDPAFILELTATPKPESNVISFVSASTLKAASMVKIPVFLFGRQGLNDVLASTQLFREDLERYADIEFKTSGRYVRPIALIQAQPKSDDDAITFERIKTALIKSGIPEEHIALKLSHRDDLKNVDLMSKDCPIRYIITVNALREGWDCPFAYILCTLAAGKSKVEVEQIVGRILRQPGAKRFSEQNLNASYVFSTRDSFQETMNSVSKGLLDSGFSKKDYRLVTDKQTYFDTGEVNIDAGNDSHQGSDQPSGNGPSDPQDAPVDDPIDIIDPELIKTAVEAGKNDPNTSAVDPNAIRKRLDEIENESKEPEKEREVPPEMSDGKTNISSSFVNEIESTVIPKLMYKGKTMLAEFQNPVSRESLAAGFDVSKRCDVDIGQTFVDDKMGKLDARSDNPDVLTFSVLQEKEREAALAVFDPDKMSDSQLSKGLSEDLFKALSPMNDVKDRHLRAYIDHFVSTHSRDDLILYRKFFPQVVLAIKRKVTAELNKYRKEQYDKLILKREIFCDLNSPKGRYRFPERIDPRNGLVVPPTLEKSLYESENNVKGFERTMLLRIMSCESVLWWHRIVERGPDEFYINGFINHYPDFVVKTKKGNIVLIETKGSHLDNPDTKSKIELGRDWASSAGQGYFYFMVFEDENKKAEGSISANEMIDNLNDL